MCEYELFLNRVFSRENLKSKRMSVFKNTPLQLNPKPLPPSKEALTSMSTCILIIASCIYSLIFSRAGKLKTCRYSSM